MASEIFVDAGAWIAINDRSDAHHGAAVAFYRQLLRDRRRLITTNLVIAEAYIAIRRHGGHQPAVHFLASARQSSRLSRLCSDATLESEAEEISRHHEDQAFSFTDAVSFALMRQP